MVCCRDVVGIRDRDVEPSILVATWPMVAATDHGVEMPIQRRMIGWVVLATKPLQAEWNSCG